MKYLARQRRAHQRAGFPVISIDAKQRELIGNFKNPGQAWRTKPLPVWESDYPSEADGVAIPYGIYDVTQNEGFVVVGTSHRLRNSRWRRFGSGGARSGNTRMSERTIC